MTKKISDKTKSKVMSSLGKSSWEKRVEKFGLEKAKEMMRELNFKRHQKKDLTNS